MTDKGGQAFTLLEIIVTLLVLGVLVAIAGMGILQVTRGYQMAATNAEITQKVQPVLLRLSKEFTEFVDFNDDATSISIDLNQDDGQHYIVYNASSNSLTINGLTLLEGVSDFSLTYYSGSNSSSSWEMSKDLRELSAIEIQFNVAHSQISGGLPFVTRVSPRNNNNLGGAPLESQPPSMPSYNCFVVTVACGQANHPLVQIFRDFRDNFLLHFELGQKVIAFYYQHGPKWAAWLQQHYIFIPFVQILLLAIAGYLLLFKYFLCFISLVMTIFLYYKKNSLYSEIKGSSLLGIIMVILIVSVLSAAMVSILSTSSMESVRSLNGLKAYYVAESGYRFAASKYLNADSDSAKKTALEDMDGFNASLGNNDGSFSLEVFPYWFEATIVNNKDLTTKVYGQVSPWIDFSQGGRLKLSGGNFQDFNDVVVSGDSIIFKSSSNWNNISIEDDVNFVALAASQTLTEGGQLSLSHYASYFPEFNGAFSLGSDTEQNIYVYRKKIGSILYGVELADSSESWRNVNISSNENIILEKFVRLRATGTVADISRIVLYNIPIGWVAGGGFKKVEYGPDSFGDTENWFSDNDESLGSFSVGSSGGNPALKVESVEQIGSNNYMSSILLDWEDLEANLAQGWMDSEGYLSYDLQVKMKASSLKYFMSSILFDFQVYDGNGDGDYGDSSDDFYTYGTSFLRARQRKYSLLWFDWWEDNDNISNGVKPAALWPAQEQVSNARYSKPAIVLWQRTSDGSKWLSYKLLTDENDKVNSHQVEKFRLRDWSTLMVRVVEGTTLIFAGGVSKISTGDTIEVAGKKARVVGTPIITSSDKSWGSNTSGKLILNNIEEPFAASGQIKVNGITCANAMSYNSTKTNYIRAYYSSITSYGTANDIQTDLSRKALSRGSVSWPPDDAQNRGAATDYFTLVEWDGVNTGVNMISSTIEGNSIIETNTLTSPSWADYQSNPDMTFNNNVGLSSGGNNGDQIYFDDFGLQLDIQSGTGFLPPIQQ